MLGLHVTRLPALSPNNGAAATWLRRTALALLFGALAATATAEPPGRLTAVPAASPVALTAATGKPVLVGYDAFLYVPRGASADRPLSLLLLFPGTGGDGRGFVAGLQSVADRANIALLGFSPGSGNFQTVDNFFDDLESGSARAKVPWPEPRFGRDVDRIDKTLAKVFATVPIDRARIGLFGFSHGGSYALTLGTANPQLFSSIAALSPGIMIVNSGLKGGQRVFLSHGRSDPAQPYRRTACAFGPRLTELGYQVEFNSFDGGHELPPELVIKAIRHFLGQKGTNDTPDCAGKE